MIPLIITIAAFTVLATIGISMKIIESYKYNHDNMKKVCEHNIEYQKKLEESYDRLGNKHNILLEDYTNLSKKNEELDIYSTNTREQLDIATKVIDDILKANNNLKDDIKSMELLTGISVNKVKQDLVEDKSKQLDEVLVQVNKDIKKEIKNKNIK